MSDDDDSWSGWFKKGKAHHVKAMAAYHQLYSTKKLVDNIKPGHEPKGIDHGSTEKKDSKTS